MKMLPGSRSKYVSIYAPPDYTDTDITGQPLDGWVFVGKRWANVRDLTGKNLFAAEQVHPEGRVAVRMRYNTEVKEGYRITYGSRTLEIVGFPADPDGSRQDLVCTCKEVR